MTKHLFITAPGETRPMNLREGNVGIPRATNVKRVPSPDGYLLAIVLCVSLSRDSSQHSISIVISVGPFTSSILGTPPLLHTSLNVGIFSLASGTPVG